MKHFLDHLAGPVATWWDDLGKPVLNDQVRLMLTEGVKEEAAGRSIAELEVERDARLVELIIASNAI